MNAASEPLTRGAFFARQAAAAWQAGQAALRDGDLARALRLLERAWRLAPDDPAAALALGGARLRAGDAAGALPLLERVAQVAATREALLLLAAARQRAGQAGPAAAALGTMLSTHLVAPTAELEALAGALVRAVGAPGWCGVAPDGRVLAFVAGTAAMRLDGKPWRPGAALPPQAERLEVSVAGRPCLGSPIELRRARRLEGVVAGRADGGLAGWAWHPGNPDATPLLDIVGADGARLRVRAEDPNVAAAPLSRPRGFAVAPEALAGLTRPLSVCGPDGAALAGSPLDPDAPLRAASAIAAAVARRFPLRGRAVAGDPLADASAPAGLRGPAAAAPLAPDRACAVVVPVYRGLAVTRACLDALLATIPPDTPVIAVDDATPEPALAALLDDLAAAGRLRLLRHRHNRGFPASANAGLRLAARLAPGADLVLLNSDAVPAPGWLDRLRAAVQGAPDIGTATPLSNDATILSYPDPVGGNPVPAGPALSRLARLAARANPDLAIEVPTAVGFCMYIRRECLAQTGLFREDEFAQGYGEENDFCIRARHLGWRHVGVPGAFVAHAGGASFGAATSPLIARNLAVLERLHPGYAALIDAFHAADPLAEARRRLDALRWAATRAKGGAAILVTHDSGGGVERVVRDRAAALRREGRRAILLRPVPDRLRAGPQGGAAYRPGLVRVDAGEGAFPNLVYAIPGEMAALAALLRPDRPAVMEVHHLLGHDHAVLGLARRLGIPEEVHLHDYAWFCPRVTLLGPDRR
jgi:GT2 family glycosyltransferase